jgi:hypothetical protein
MFNLAASRPGSLIPRRLRKHSLRADVDLTPALLPALSWRNERMSVE